MHGGLRNCRKVCLAILIDNKIIAWIYDKKSCQVSSFELWNQTLWEGQHLEFLSQINDVNHRFSRSGTGVLPEIWPNMFYIP